MWSPRKWAWSVKFHIRFVRVISIFCFVSPLINLATMQVCRQGLFHFIEPDTKQTKGNYRSVPGKCPRTTFQGATVAASIQTYGILILGKRPCRPKSLVMFKHPWALTRDTTVMVLPPPSHRELSILFIKC